MYRGGLVHPVMFAVNAVAHNSAVVAQITKQELFLKHPNQHRAVTDLNVELLTKDESSNFHSREDGHTSVVIQKHVLWCSTNILLKNFYNTTKDKILGANSK
ncbi:hypothetical protein HPB50_027830 [Hyalomma asiaticum]|nr:hypothetical protein HPB50_027830 [Hyalomma asiaticum]